MESCIYNTGGYCFNRDCMEVDAFRLPGITDHPECPWVGQEGECEHAEEG